MPNFFQRKHNSLLTGPVARWSLGLVIACLLISLVASPCNYRHDYGVIAVESSDDGFLAATKSVISGALTKYDYSLYRSNDGGLTWILIHTTENASSAYEPPINQEQVVAETPCGSYLIDASGIVLQDLDGRKSAVYPTAHWQSSSNQWILNRETRHLERPYELPLGPLSIAHDSRSGNVVAALGILGVVVGTPDGQWTGVVVGEYSPVEFSGGAKLKALLAINNFWASVITFPFFMIALAFVFKDVTHGGFRLRGNPEIDWRRDTEVSSSPKLQSLPDSSSIYFARRSSAAYHSQFPTHGHLYFEPMSTVSFMFLILSIPSPIFLGMLGSGATGGGWVWWIGAISVGTSVSASAIAWRGQWKVHWAALLGSYLAMAAFVALPFLVWVQTGLPLGILKALAVVLCLAVAVAIYLRLNYKPSSPSDMDETTGSVPI